MPSKKQNIKYPLLAGIAYLLAIALLIHEYTFHRNTGVFDVVYIVGLVVVAFTLITKRRDLILPIGFAIVAISQIGKLFIYFSLIKLFYMIAYASMTFFCFTELTDHLPQYKEKCKKLWYLPAVAFATALFADLINITSHFDYWDIRDLFYVLRDSVLRDGLVFARIITFVGVLWALLWVFHPNGLPKRDRAETKNEQRDRADTEDEQRDRADMEDEQTAQMCVPSSEVYCDLVKHFLLLLFTFGIWLLIWIYRMTKHTNAVKGEEERDPTTKLLLCMFVPFYQIYWTYKTAQRVDKLARCSGVFSDLSAFCLLTAFFSPMIPPIMIQDKMNALAAGTHIGSKNIPSKDAQPQAVAVDFADELMKIKELFDSDIITQEEFDAKKKQLLGL